MMKLIVFILLCCTLCVTGYAFDDQEARELFKNFVSVHNKNYQNDPVEYEKRFSNFKLSLLRINKIQKHDRQAKYSINKFSDLSKEEFSHQRLMKQRNAQELAVSCLANGVEAPHMDVNSIPDSFDWRTRNVVTAVKDQGQCGSCWAFSTIETIESQYALKGNPLTVFSEQLLVDCSVGCCEEMNETVCNSGCDGGWQWNAYIDIMNWGGVETEAEYPYTAVDGTCQRTQKDIISPIKNYTCLSTPNGADEGQMAAYLVANGPIAIALNADYLQDYESGIIDPWFTFECDPTSLDHALVIVGYGQSTDVFGTTNFWIIRNSWNADWGEDGYFRIVRGNGACGVNNAVSAVIM